jgi:Cu2+-containing amine oxidase
MRFQRLTLPAACLGLALAAVLPVAAAPGQAPVEKPSTSAAAPPAAAKPAATTPAAPTPAAAKPRPKVSPAPTHPLDPLTASEITSVVNILRARTEMVPANAFFPQVALNEPPKAEVRAFKPGTPFRREAAVVVFDRAANRTFEAIVDLRAKSLVTMTPVKDAQPAIMFEEFDKVPPLVRAHPDFVEAMKKRGIANVNDVQVDPWAPGLLDPKTEPRWRWST